MSLVQIPGGVYKVFCFDLNLKKSLGDRSLLVVFLLDFSIDRVDLVVEPFVPGSISGRGLQSFLLQVRVKKKIGG